MTDSERGDDQWGVWRGRIGASRKRRDERLPEWQENVTARKGVLAPLADTTSTINARTNAIGVNQDWPLTKAKVAQLYSQTPEVRLMPRDDAFRPAVPIFGRELNDTIQAVSVGTTIEEVLCDVVNAAGIGGVLVSCDTRTEAREVPVIDPATLPPDQQMAAMQGALEIPTTTVEHPVDIRYLAQRISPSDLLVPSDFTGSNYDHARWLGEDGRMTWSQAVNAFGLDESVKEKVLGRDKRMTGTSLNTDSTVYTDTDVVTYTQLFYWRHYYHQDETNFKALQRLVFVDGLEEPVINEPYQAQRRVGDRLVGVTKNPIRVLTLTYISDDSLPPSDSSISRGDVDELSQFREGERQQRKHSIPVRWFDTNRVSPNTRSLLERGTPQGFIPTNGPGDRAIGEVARTNYPPERLKFEDNVKNDLTEKWQVGSNQTGAFASGERSAREAGIIEKNFQRRVGQEQDKVSKFFLGIAEVLAGHLALYGTFDLPDELGQNREFLADAFTYSVRVDSTVRLDAEQRIDQLLKAWNVTGQTGYVNPKAIVSEIWELSGVDPSKVVIDPQPKPPEPLKISVSTALELRDPIMLAAAMRTHQAPTPDDVSAAIKLLNSLAGPGPQVPPPPPPDGRPPAEIVQPDIETAPRIDRRAEDFGA